MSQDEDDAASVLQVPRVSTGIQIVYLCRSCNAFSSTNKRAVSAHYGHKCGKKNRRNHPYNRSERAYTMVRIQVGEHDQQAGGRSRPRNRRQQQIQNDSDEETLEQVLSEIMETNEEPRGNLNFQSSKNNFQSFFYTFKVAIQL